MALINQILDEAIKFNRQSQQIDIAEKQLAANQVNAALNRQHSFNLLQTKDLMGQRDKLSQQLSVQKMSLLNQGLRPPTSATPVVENQRKKSINTTQNMISGINDEIDILKQNIVLAETVSGQRSGFMNSALADFGRFDIDESGKIEGAEIQGLTNSIMAEANADPDKFADVFKTAESVKPVISSMVNDLNVEVLKRDAATLQVDNLKLDNHIKSMTVLAGSLSGGKTAKEIKSAELDMFKNYGDLHDTSIAPAVKALKSIDADIPALEFLSVSGSKLNSTNIKQYTDNLAAAIFALSGEKDQAIISGSIGNQGRHLMSIISDPVKFEEISKRLEVNSRGMFKSAEKKNKQAVAANSLYNMLNTFVRGSLMMAANKDSSFQYKDALALFNQSKNTNNKIDELSFLAQQLKRHSTGFVSTEDDKEADKIYNDIINNTSQSEVNQFFDPNFSLETIEEARRQSVIGFDASTSKMVAPKEILEFSVFQKAALRNSK